MSAVVAAPYVAVAAGVNAISGGAITNALGLGPDEGAATAKKADPFGPYRANLAEMYAGALQPGQNLSPYAMPGFSQFNSGVMAPAMETAQRTGTAAGALYSGNEKIALQNVAQKGYYGFMTDYLNRLAQGAGAVNDPARAVGMGVAQDQASAAGIMQGFGGLATGLAGIARSSGSVANSGLGYGTAGTAATTSMVSDGAGGFVPVI